MIGYCAIGSSGTAIAPIKQMNSATTQAKIGLSMKKLAMARYRVSFWACRLSAVASASDQDCGFTLSPAANFWKPSTTTLSPAFRPSVTNQSPSCTEPGAHRLHGDVVVVLDDEHLAAAAAIALDRLLRHRDRVAVESLVDADADIHARQQLALGIAEFAAQGHLAGMGIDLGIGEQQLAVERIKGVVVEHEAHLGGIGRDALEVAALEGAAELVELGHRLGEVGIDRIELLDAGEVGLVLHRERTLADQRRTDDAVDRRAHGGIVEIKFGAREFGLAAFDLGMGLTLGRDRLLVLGFRGSAILGEGGDAVRLLPGLHQPGLGLGDGRLGGHHLDLERTRIDAIERIARLHLAALTEQALDDDAGDARPHVGDARRRDAARQLAHHGARLRLDDDDADVRIGGLGSGHRRDGFVAAREQRRKGREHRLQRMPIAREVLT